MPIQIYRRQNEEPNELAQAILAGTQGFVQGRQLRNQSQEAALSNAYKQAQIAELQRKTATGGFTPGQQISRATFQQRFGIDPITGEDIPEDRLRQPRFGVSGDPILDQLISQAAQSRTGAPGNVSVRPNLQGQQSPEQSLRTQAEQELRAVGAPVTEANLREAMRQLGG